MIATAKNATPSRGIDAFTRVSKAGGTTKDIFEKHDHINVAVTTQLEESTRKRKAVHIEEEEPPILSANKKPLRQHPQQHPKTPQKPITNGTTSQDTPTQGARTLLDKLFVSSKNSTPKPTPSPELPSELLDLINLHAAFLTALSLHYAHNGTHSPADLRALCPDVARAWGKRRVTLEDIRRTLGIMNTNITSDTQLSLSDYGHGKICVEIAASGKAGRLVRPVNEDLLNEIFVRALRTFWERDGEDLKVFIEGLPLEPITTCSSLLKMSPLLAKGQRRLEDMKAGIIVKSVKEKVPAETGMTLLERLRAKQLEKSKMLPPPSKAQLSRKAALQRIEEVVGVLTVLSTSSSVGQQRISFTLPTVLGKLRDSFKTPMSKEEGDICVRLLASEIAPDWVRIVKMGKVEALVVNRDERPSEFDVRERVKSVL